MELQQLAIWQMTNVGSRGDDISLLCIRAARELAAAAAARCALTLIVNSRVSFYRTLTYEQVSVMELIASMLQLRLL